MQVIFFLLTNLMFNKFRTNFIFSFPIFQNNKSSFQKAYALLEQSHGI